MSAYDSPRKNSSRRLLGIGCVLLFHGLLFYAINSGLTRKFVKILQGPVETKLIEEAKPELPPLPPPPPRPWATAMSAANATTPITASASASFFMMFPSGPA